MKKNLFAGFILLFFLSPIVSAQPKYEFRAAWIATVANIDWPSRGNYHAASQKEEFISLLNMHQRNGLNAVVVQVRPATDALYPSPYEPWSQWLTGRQGRPPYPFYDPLQFMITETHKRGMEFHAWVNPYRAEFSIGVSSIAPTHITRVHPEWFLAYGGTRYFDPGNKEAQLYVTTVIRDMVKRYDVDAVHFDDYFYPYRIAGQHFPDSESFKKYGNGLTEAEWRRSNVDSIIIMLSRAIKEENKYCRFGISPFGVWRNKDSDPEGSNTRAGVTNYDDLYADILLWLQKGWIDYVAPQIYWEIGHRAAPFEVLLDWWANHSYDRHLYIGQGVYRVNENNPSWKRVTELPNQIKLIREYPGAVHGSVYFSSKTFVRNPNGWNDTLQRNYYKFPALIPPMPWIDSIQPPAPVAIKIQNGIWQFSTPNESRVKYFVIYCNADDPGSIHSAESIIKILPAENGKAVFDNTKNAAVCTNLGVTMVNRTNLESEIVPFE